MTGGMLADVDCRSVRADRAAARCHDARATLDDFRDRIRNSLRQSASAQIGPIGRRAAPGERGERREIAELLPDCEPRVGNGLRVDVGGRAWLVSIAADALGDRRAGIEDSPRTMRRWVPVCR